MVPADYEDDWSAFPLPVEHDAADLSRSAAGLDLRRGLSRPGCVPGAADRSSRSPATCCAIRRSSCSARACSAACCRPGSCTCRRSRCRPTASSRAFSMIVLLLWSTGDAGLPAVHQRDHPAGEKPAAGRASGTAITIGKRSSHLHGPYSGDLFVRWIGAAAIGPAAGRPGALDGGRAGRAC